MGLFNTSWEIPLKEYNPEDGYTADVKELESRDHDEATGEVVDSSYLTPNVNLSTIYVEADPDYEGVVSRYSFQDYIEKFDSNTSTRFADMSEEIERKIVTAYKAKGNAYLETPPTSETPSFLEMYMSNEPASVAAAKSFEYPVDVSVGFVYNSLDSSIARQIEAGDNFVVVGYDSDTSN